MFKVDFNLGMCMGCSVYQTHDPPPITLNFSEICKGYLCINLHRILASLGR